MLIKDSGNNTTDNSAVNPHHWVSRYADYLYTYAVLRINDDDLSRDLVQETFLAALEQMQNFKGNSTEKTWLTAILKNKIMDVYRSRSKGLVKGVKSINPDGIDTGFFDDDTGHWNDQHRPANMGIEQADAVENKEFQQILTACMNKLPDLWRAVFSMKHIDDESTEMICSELKLSSSNFWVIVHRSKINLRSCLQKNWI